MAESLFTSQTPAVPDADDGSDYTLGTVIVPAVDGTVTDGRWFFPATLPSGPVDFVLYDEVTEAELERATFAAPVAGAWNTVAITPVAVTAGQVLVACVETPNRYVATNNFFVVSLTNGNLTGPDSITAAGNGRLDTAVSTFPGTPAPTASCYFVDLVFTAEGEEDDQTANLGLIVETDSAQPMTADQSVTLGLVTETDTAQPMGVMFDQSVDLGLVIETDTALSMAASIPGSGTDVTILPWANALLNCLCTAIATVPDPPEDCCLRTGEVVSLNVSLSADECCKGLAWVRVVSIFPSEQNFPDADAEPRNCPPQWFAVVLEMGVARCSPVGTAMQYPNCGDWTAYSQKVLHDAAAMRRAFCCLDLSGSEKILGVWEPLPTEGGCGGGIQTVTIQVPNCDGCEDM